MSDDSGRPANRLAESSSPYLLLHKHNPVDWYPWGREALERARREDKPIFVSVGYSTCYWCHVMERESFSDEAVAELMNREFVNIKLDREERPDLDEIYMTATQILTGQGGWPNSVFLTPDLEPYFAGTYFPPEDRHGLPSFRTVLTSMADAWRSRRDDVEQQAKSVGDAIRHHLGDRPGPAEAAPGADVVERSFAALTRSFDPEWGGFGGAPKFPSPSNLLLLEGLAGTDQRAGEMLSATLDQMARGGIYDQLGGGFHRYATDREWKIPHFEKMLYDNGWLLELYAREHERTGDVQAARIVRETATFLAREMTSPEGALWSALDAETNGEEGAFYVWTRNDLLGVLGEEDFGFLAPLMGFAGAPFFEGDQFVLHLPERFEAQAARRRMDADELVAEIEPLRRKLLKARSARRRPLTDDKVLTDWNGSAIAGLAESGRSLGEKDLTDQASAAARFVLSQLRPNGELLHAWRDGVAHTPAMLTDYTYLVRGLLALHRATGDGAWLESAKELTREQLDRLLDADGGFFVAQQDDDLLVRSRDLFDGATPAANAVAVFNLLELSVLEPEADWSERAQRALRAFAPVVNRVPEATRTLALAVHRHGGRGEGAPGLPDAAGEERLESEAVSARIEQASDGRFTLELEIGTGWHLYADEAGAAAPGMQPLAIIGRDAELVEIELPAPVRLPAAGHDAGEEDRPLVFKGSLTVSGRVSAAGPDPRLEVSFQACDDRRCLAPEALLVRLGKRV